jgi:uncharacterized protein (DUF302 family)
MLFKNMTMTARGKKILIRGAFEALIDRLSVELKAYGFNVFGPMIVQKDQPGVGPQLKYHVILADLPSVSSQMISICPHNGTILPSCISVMEIYPGEIEVVLMNPTELLASMTDNVQLLGLACEVTKCLEDIMSGFESVKNYIPDLVTSWG